MRIVIEREQDGRVTVWTDSGEPVEVVLLEHGGSAEGRVELDALEFDAGASFSFSGSVYPKEVYQSPELVEQVFDASNKLWPNGGKYYGPRR